MPRGERFAFNVHELSGALGDLGTLLPLMLGTIAVVGLPPFPVLIGFGLFYVAIELFYRLPIPVQAMKAVAAVLLTAHVSSAVRLRLPSLLRLLLSQHTQQCPGGSHQAAQTALAQAR
jgi:hypothetical protein